MITADSELKPYKTKFTNSAATSFSDNTADKGGDGDGFRPHELLEAAFACCMNMSVRMYADKQSINLDSVTTHVTIDRTEPGEACFEYSIQLNGDISEKETNDILEMVKNCPVRKTLSSTLSFKIKG
ncbi:OsmC family protein [Marinomonas spartinae]|uniref:OsmC family protein n=1 Tax=Marinomonas spartinae TaxID=1792290 RepID=UPI0018F19956|nr:OsmC family protein [Marinomonas spartinae]MBJ7555492.1 OsmC family protein [Marinomonas spartinae]